MDFFAQQDRARRNARLLLVLFTLAVLALLVLVNALVAGFLWVSRDYNLYSGGTGLAGYLEALSWERIGSVSIIVVITIGLVSLVRWLQLATGGKAVAEGMGARRILRDSNDPDEQRCLNVVEELALAANMPVPPLYLLPNERGINAFAAGVTPADAVIAVTRGTLLQLKRHELQGVIGHELSHILNGDMRLSIRLAALLKGITFISDMGELLLRGGVYRRGPNRESGRGALMPVFGLGLVTVGWLGTLSASFIKAAISRQKEYLADASAVQFTRDNEGIADALKVIGGFIPGSLVHAARAPEMSHIFFGEIRHHIWQGFATHPPLDDRIFRLDPRWDGQYLQREERRYGREVPGNDMALNREALVLAAAAASVAGVDEPASHESPALASVDTALLRASEDPLGATALVLSLHAAAQPGQEPELLKIVEEHGARGQARLLQTLLPAAQGLRPGQRFPLVCTAMPALKSLSTPQYRQFKSTLLLLIRADRRTNLFEWCLFQLLRHYLDPYYLGTAPSSPRHRHLAKVRAPLRLALSVLAHHSHGSSEAAFAIAVETLDLAGMSLQPLGECSVVAFSRAVHTLADCYPLLKPRILKALMQAASSDGRVNESEREIIIAVAAVMDCPLPKEIADDWGLPDNTSISTSRS